MCTVSFVKTQNKIVLTSNRDEQVIRPSAIDPQSYVVNNKKLFFPKDPKAGGTWFAVSENQTIVVLLNGAEEKHQVKNSYRKSRGLIVLEIASAQSAITAWAEIDLENIEPFTLVLFQNEKLYQLRWNEIEKETINLDTRQAHVWSSATLYPKHIREQRSNWFHTFINKNLELSETDLLKFHKHTEAENSQNGLIINRENHMKTLSITQAVVHNNQIKLSHHNLMEQTISEQIIRTQ